MLPENKRVVITGLGAMTPIGIGVPAYWSAALAGRSGVGPITEFDASNYDQRIAASVRDFNPEQFMDRKEVRRTARFTQFALAATLEAIADAGLDMAKEDSTRVGVEIGTAVGGMDIIERYVHVLANEGPRKINPVFAPAVIANMASCYVAIAIGARGPASTPVAACATGTVAIGEAMHRIRRGEADVIIAGGTESVMTPLAIVAFGRMGALSCRNEEPEKACRPFDAHRDGTVVGEGAAVLVLETLEHALARGARIRAEVVGYGFTEDAFHVAAPEPSGDGARRAMVLALQTGGLVPSQVDYICAHGTGTPLNDVSETIAIKAALGEERAYQVAISSVKSMVGHMLGAAGSISVVTCVKAIEDGWVPPTINLETPDPQCDLDYVPNQARRMKVDVALANAFGFGGQNACIAVRRFVA